MDPKRRDKKKGEAITSMERRNRKIRKQRMGSGRAALEQAEAAGRNSHPAVHLSRLMMVMMTYTFMCSLGKHTCNSKTWKHRLWSRHLAFP